MAFIARVDKPCTQCGVVIPKGTQSGFTWDRTKGGFIHLDCLKVRKGEKVPAPKPNEIIGYCSVCSIAVGALNASVSENGGIRHTECKPETVPVQPAAVSVVPSAATLRGIKRAVAAEQAVTGSTADQLAKLIQSLAGARGIDESEVRRIAADEAAKVSVNRSIAIKVGEMPEVKLDLAHKDLPLLVKLCSTVGATGHKLNIYMHGAAGSGKSTAARQTSEVLKLEYGYISLNPMTPDSRLLGYMHAGGEYVPSEFFRRYTEGGVFCIDEIDNAAASLVTTLNGLLENGHGAFPHGVFARHKDFVCVCTANTIGRGGDINYPERRALDGAFLERFMFLQWGYDTDLTKAIVSGILGAAASAFISWVDQEARTLQARFPTLIVSPRAYIQGAVLEKMNLSRNQINAMVIARGLK